jgi:hypothetical protein
MISDTAIAKGRILKAITDGIYFTNNMSFDGTDWNCDDVTLPASIFSMSSTSLTMRYAPAGSNPRTVALVRALHIDTSTGNIGIGAAPGAGAKLQVIGSISATVGPSTNHTACWKTGGILGYCSTVVDSTGSCTCN